ncbi:ribonuclease H2 catalytic subunit RNH201 [Lachancea thermotolerans CBS 6340]|uniref:Ribonuclease n=1 Tax=Lachancea thermotolerans (strain ATCC 56472 / CBS 6340 / NRRL Y-8284) TaxID=559295 RepID=C5DMH4_LACTC|nr:KLTH0G08976p [Lachancea thermotolerans CBS 6340]CAR24985.1 KLTH0G08976p [Lachancea thermotolerans CBS 6340]
MYILTTEKASSSPNFPGLTKAIKRKRSTTMSANCGSYRTPKSPEPLAELPPTVLEAKDSLHSRTFYSEVPQQIRDSGCAVILGVDEAGRGPVLGPMVYGISYCTREYQDEVLKKRYAFDDSKKLTDPVRRDLFQRMYTGEIDQVGYATTCISACDISSGMLRFPPEKNYNLNEQAHDVTIALIRGVLERGVAVEHVYVDTVGPPATYQRKLEGLFPSIKFTVAKKADSLFCVVSVASVVAKVTRDVLIELLRARPDEVLGSGYPSDAKTTAWLRSNRTALFGWPLQTVRFSWQTSQTLLDRNPDAVPIEWEDDYIGKGSQSMAAMFQPAEKAVTLDNWYSVE